MQVDVLFDPFGGRWGDLGEAAGAAERAGFDGAWLYDHLAGAVHDAPHVLECWTTLTAIAATVPRLQIGPMVLNVANRDPAMLAVMAATLQEVSGGRLLLGLGAGGGRTTPYAAEQWGLGRDVPGDAARRAAVEAAVATLRRVWSGSTDGVGGFLIPTPVPPVIIGGFGPKMARLAGLVGDGMNAPGGPRLAGLVEVARRAHESVGGDADRFVVTASAGADPGTRRRLEAAGVHRLLVLARPPYVDSVNRLAAALG